MVQGFHDGQNNQEQIFYRHFPKGHLCINCARKHNGTLIITFGSDTVIYHLDGLVNILLERGMGFLLGLLKKTKKNEVTKRDSENKRVRMR